ncbi:MAG: hypothetical protein JNM91_06815 [Flavobacteriales bacterium]|jgi:predicted phage tail protein|nr:hypothetical protein [Flavobacteriales bacterium]
MSIVMAVPRRGIVRSLLVRVTGVVAVALVLVVTFGGVVGAVTFGVGAFLGGIVGILSRRTAGEKECGGEEGNKRAFHVDLGFGLLV